MANDQVRPIHVLEEVNEVLNQFRPRRATATVELALLLPVLAFLFVIAVDWSRIFYYSMIVTNSARNGALYASDPVTQPSSPYTSVSQAALADAQGVSPTPTVGTPVYGTDSAGAAYVDVTVSYPFQTVTNFPGVPASTTLVRTVRMRVQAALPN